jgi:hypothetical protein
MEKKKGRPVGTGSGIKRKIVTLSIQPELHEQFRRYCEENSLIGSSLIQGFIRDLLKNNQ